MQPSFEVAHADGATLLIPETACAAAPGDESNVKLSVEGLRDLISLAETFDAPRDDPDRAGGGLGDAPAGSAPAHRRGTGRDPGRGDAS